MANVEFRAGVDTGFESGMAAALAEMQMAARRMRAEFSVLGASAHQVRVQIGTTMRQAGTAVRVSLEAWRRFSAPIERTISNSLTDAILGIRQSGGLRSIMLGIEKQVVGGMVGNVVKSLGTSLVKPLFTSLLGSGGLGGGIANLLFGGGAQAAQIAAITANTTALAANTAALLGSATASTASAAGGALSAAGSAGGILGGFKTVFGWLGFSGGGIVPSAAGGWSLPNFAGAQPALLHSQEMVLPADISQGLQGMIRSGGPNGANGGDVHVHNHFHGPADGASVGRWFSGNKDALAATIRDAWNSGALAFP